MGSFKETIILGGVLPVVDTFFHTNITRWYKTINNMQKWSPDQIKEWQLSKLHQLIDNAYNYSVYYRELFDTNHIKPSDILTFSDLEKIPPLTKEIIRERFNDILLSNKDRYYYKPSATGGSTGDPTKYIKDNESWGFDNAFNTIMWKQVGYHYGDRFLALGSSSIFPTNKCSVLHTLFYRMKGKYPFNAMNLSEEVLMNCVKTIQKRNIHFIYGYASAIYLLAKYVKRKNLGEQLSIKACFPTSEILTNTYRATIEDAFGCVVLDSYGANDGGIVAHSTGSGYKVGYNCIVQIEQSQSQDRKNTGVALLTDVTNMVFPFIRYRLGDELELGDGYNTFYNGQVLKKVIGRTSDIIELENGRNLTGPGFTILFKDLHVIGYRIFKSAPMQITVEIVKGHGYDQDEEKLIVDTMHKHAGNDCNIIIKYSDSIANRKNGKNLFFLN